MGTMTFGLSRMPDDTSRICPVCKRPVAITDERRFVASCATQSCKLFGLSVPMAFFERDLDFASPNRVAILVEKGSASKLSIRAAFPTAADAEAWYGYHPQVYDIISVNVEKGSKIFAEQELEEMELAVEPVCYCGLPMKEHTESSSCTNPTPIPEDEVPETYLAEALRLVSESEKWDRDGDEEFDEEERAVYSRGELRKAVKMLIRYMRAKEID